MQFYIWLSSVGRMDMFSNNLSFRLVARDILYSPSHSQESTYHDICNSSCGALVGTRFSSMGLSRGIDPTTVSGRFATEVWPDLCSRCTVRDLHSVTMGNVPANIYTTSLWGQKVMCETMMNGGGVARARVRVVYVRLSRNNMYPIICVRAWLCLRVV